MFPNMISSTRRLASYDDDGDGEETKKKGFSMGIYSCREKLRSTTTTLIAKYIVAEILIFSSSSKAILQHPHLVLRLLRKFLQYVQT
jgi:hypothetical protein